jgi:hypothetical protein
VLLHQLIVDGGAILAQAPNPGHGSAPPGSGGFTKILSWAMWLALGICVLGFIGAGAMMAVQSRHGQGGEHASRLGWVMAGCVVVGGAAGFVNALV